MRVPLRLPVALLAGGMLTPAQAKPLPLDHEMMPSAIAAHQRLLPLPQPECVDELDPYGLCLSELRDSAGYCQPATLVDGKGNPWQVYDCRPEGNPLGP